MRVSRFGFALVALLASMGQGKSQQPFALGNPNAPAVGDLSVGAGGSFPAKVPAAPFALAPPPGAAPDPSPTSTRDTSPQPVNESALRYYAALNDVARMSVEIRRLRSLYPNWEPPADLLNGSTSPQDEQPLWDLFSQGKYEEMQPRMAELQTSNSDWQPSAVLAEKLKTALQRKQLLTASDAKLWGQVIEIASNNSDLLVCADVDAIWRVAEALVQTGDKDKAFEAYRYILANCRDDHERLATVQKASLILEPATTRTLIEMGRRKPDGTPEFQAVMADLLRRKIGMAVSDPTGESPAPGDLDALAHIAAQSNSGKDLQLLGWYYYSRKDFAVAQSWFNKSLAVDHDAKSAEGLALSLRAAGKLQEAEDTAFLWRAASPEIREAFIEIVSSQITASPPSQLTAERQSRFSQLLQDEKSALGAQSLGWYLYTRGDIRGAKSWFQKSVDWKPTEEAVVGLAISARRSGDMATSRLAIQTYGASFPRAADLEKLWRPEGLRSLAADRADVPAPSRSKASRVARATRDRTEPACD